MLIKSVYIEQFGKLKKKTFVFRDGINVIQGKNEVGKSTLQNFILSSFYGARTSRRNNLDTRKKYIPYGKNYSFGTMEIINRDQNLIIERKISGKRKDDLFRIYDKDTYDQAPYSENLGKDFFDVELEEFIKTLYISQNGTKFLNEKDEALSTKLTNLIESGDEEVSFTKAMNTLDKEMKLVKGSRKNGRLDQLYQELSDLHLSLEESKSRQKQMLEIEEKLQKLENENQEKKAKKNDIQMLKDRIHLYQVKDEFLRIRKSLDELTSLKEEKKSRFIMVDDKELKKIREKEMKLRDLEEDFVLLDDRLEGMKRQKIEIDMSLEPFKGYEEIGRDSILNMVRLQGEEMLIEEKLKYFKQDSSFNKNLLVRREELSRLLKTYEKHLTGLKPKRQILYITSASLLLAAFLYHALTDNLIISGVIGTFSFLLFYSSKHLEKKRVSYHLNKVDPIEDAIRTMAKELQMDPNEVIRSKRLIDKMPRDKELMQLKSRYDEILNFKNKVFHLTNSRNIESLLQGEKEYHLLLERVKEIEKEIQLNEKELLSKRAQKEDVLRTYKELITMIGYSENEHDLSDFLELYDLEVMRLNDLSSKETGLKYALKGLIGERGENEVLEELNALSSLGITDDLDLKSLEEKERSLTSREQEIIEEAGALKLEMKELEYMEPLLIEDSILSLQSEEKKLKRRYEIMEITKSVMKDSYEKLRKEFTSTLNEKVTAIYKEITGTDRTIKVDEIFSMNYQESGMLWNDAFLSHGSMEQLYLSLRLAMADLIYKNGKVPLILDEAFSSYDEERLNRVLAYLQKCTDRYQIFIFTCHRREAEILKEKADIISI